MEEIELIAKNELLTLAQINPGNVQPITSACGKIQPIAENYLKIHGMKKNSTGGNIGLTSRGKM
jgi:hypothetical protein